MNDNKIVEMKLRFKLKQSWFVMVDAYEIFLLFLEFGIVHNCYEYLNREIWSVYFSFFTYIVA